MDIKETIAEAHGTAVEKGFWKENWNLGEKLMLITTELGEGLEADRTGKYANREQYDLDIQTAWQLFNEVATGEDHFGTGESKNYDDYSKATIQSFEKNIKDSLEDELADATIRLFDLAGKMNVDLAYHIRKKMDYNKTRDKLHGKKY